MVGIICSLVVTLAPGNAIRESYFPTHYHFFHSIWVSLKASARIIFEHIINPFYWFFLILIQPFVKRINQQYPLFSAKPLLSFVGFIVFIALLFFPVEWATGYEAPSRTISFIATCVLLFFPIWLIALLHIYKEKIGGICRFINCKSNKSVYITVAIIALMSSSLTAPTLIALVHDLIYAHTFKSQVIRCNLYDKKTASKACLNPANYPPAGLLGWPKNIIVTYGFGYPKQTK